MEPCRCCALFLVLAAVAGAGHATIRYVHNAGSDDGTCASSSAPCDTIGYAISQSVSGDTIRVRQGGLYAETIEVSTAIAELTIEGGWADSFGWQNLDPTATVIDGDDDDHVFLVRPASGTTHITIKNLTIQDGTASATYGGGVAVHTLTGVTAKVTLDGVVLRDNHAGVGGGAAVRAWGGTAELDIRDSLVIDNVAGEGGGFAAIADLEGTGKLRFDSSTARGNQAQDWPDSNGYGGGFYANAIREGTAEIDIVNSMVVQNSADWAGGGYAQSGACGSCGEVANTNIDLLNSTVTDNGTKAITVRSWDHGVTDLDLVNSIAWGNGFYDIDAMGDYETTVVTAWNSDVGNVDTGFNSTYSTLGDVIDIDPEFVDPGTSDYHLTAGSPLIDAGVCGVLVSGPTYIRIAPFWDIEDDVRPPPANLSDCDVGADEYVPFERWVSPTGSDSANDCTESGSPCATIQHAIDEAMSNGSRYKTDVHLAVGSYDGPVSIADSPAPVTILGGWSSDFSTRQLSAFATTIDGNGSGSALAFSVVNGKADLTLEDVRLTDGVAVRGGGLSFFCQLSHGTLTLDRVVMEDNHATDSGGGLRVRALACDLEARLTDTLVGDNDAFNGGGGAWFRVDDGAALDATVYSSTVADNDASYGGGLVFVQTAGTGKGWLFLNGALVALNTGVSDGPDDLWIEEAGTGFALVNAKNSSIQSVTQWGGLYQADGTVLDVNPGFADPTGKDYHLTPYSPVLDLGLCGAGSTFDCDGDDRPPTGCDMGADEYVGPWTPPQDLWITDEHLTGGSIREACRSVTAGPDVTVGSGTVELRAGEYLAFGNGVEILDGANFQARLYLHPACP